MEYSRWDRDGPKRLREQVEEEKQTGLEGQWQMESLRERVFR